MNLCREYGEPEKVPVLLFPIPVKDKISFSIAIQAITIIDITGKVIKNHDSETKALDLSQLSNGIYFLKGRTANGNT